MAAPEKAVVQAAEKLMRDTMKRYDPSHDAYHVERVRKTALALAREHEGPVDILVVELAALLHDVLDKKYVSAEEAADPYSYFLPFFNTWRHHGVDLVSSGRGQQIASIIDNVSWTTEKKRRANGQWGDWHDKCVELHCVQDADRLDAIGAFGIMRCAAFSCATNRPLHVPLHEANATESAIGHFREKLVHIHNALKTEAGKRLGEKRHKTILDFLELVDEEYNADIASN